MNDAELKTRSERLVGFLAGMRGDDETVIDALHDVEWFYAEITRLRNTLHLIATAGDSRDRDQHTEWAVAALAARKTKEASE